MGKEADWFKVLGAVLIVTFFTTMFAHVALPIALGAGIGLQVWANIQTYRNKLASREYRRKQVWERKQYSPPYAGSKL